MTKPRWNVALLTAGLILVLGGCSTSDSNLNNRLPNWYNTMGGFGVVASAPPVMETYVERWTDLRVRFNEAVDKTSVGTNYKLTEYFGQESKDVSTLLMPPQFSDSDTVMIFQVNQELVKNANYRLSISGVKSVSARDMSHVFDLTFSTGSGYGYGYGRFSLEGPPDVINVHEDYWEPAPGVPCIGVTIEFTEDLMSPPLGRYKKSWYGIIPGGGSPLNFWKTYQDRTNYWSADIGCGCSNLSTADYYTVELFEAVDLTEDFMVGDREYPVNVDFLQSCGFL